MALAGSSPTRIVASPGARPYSATNASTSAATSARTRAATALPSMIWAATALILRPAFCDWRVARHELALRAVGGEAHDDDVRLDRCHDAVPERRMDDVVADAELRRGRGCRAAAPGHRTWPDRGRGLAAPRGH